MLYLDITRGEQQYRVQVYKRLGPDDPYQIKVWNINDADNSVKTQVQSLSRTSSGIRQHIWENLQLKTSDDNKLTEVFFTHDYHSEIEPSADITHITEV